MKDREITIVPEEEMMKDDIEEKLFEKTLTHSEINYGILTFSGNDEIVKNLPTFGERIVIIDSKDGQKIDTYIDNKQFIIMGIKVLIKKYDVRVGDIIRLKIHQKNQIFIEFINREMKKLTCIESRNQVILALNINFLKNAEFDPGSYVDITYDKGKITIVPR